MLFIDKGCITCHSNLKSGRSSLTREGPDLSLYRNDPAFLERWLADPKAVRPATTMPKLDLAPDEIADLIAFLNSPAASPTPSR